MPTYYNESRALTPEEMTVNANYILDYLTERGWTKNAVCGMLGNMQTESSINPNRWQSDNIGNMSGGYGLVQWTPATKYIDWANDRNYDYTTMESNLARILYEVENNAQWGNDSLGNSPPYDFAGFTISTESAYTLGMNFLRYYERPEVYDQPARGTQATTWFDTLTGGSGGGGGYIPTRKMKLLFYCRKRRVKYK